MISFPGRALPTPRPKRTGQIIALIGIVLVALNLRGPIVAPSTVIGSIRESLGMSATELALLTTIPVLCFALAVPLAALIIRVAGPERALTISMAGVLVGTLVRVAGSEIPMLAGTVILGAAITIGNISVPVIIKKDFNARAGPVTGAYTAALNVGSVVTALGTAPLDAAFGWRVALGVWAVLSLAALIPWALPAVGARPGNIEPSALAGSTNVVRRPSIWLLAIAFGGQGFSYYALTAWLPEILADELSIGFSASGAASALFQVSAIAGALSTASVSRILPARVHFAGIAAAWAALPLSLLVVPSLWWVGSILGGAAQGAAVTLVFIVVARVTSNSAETARASAIVQFVGYGFGAVGPLLLGGLHDATGSWAVPLGLLVGASGVLGAAGWLSVRTAT